MFEYDRRVSAKNRQIFATRLRTPTLCIVSDMETPQAPAEALLIDSAQKSAIPRLSMRKAAEMAGMSEGRWRQIVKGYQGTGTGRLAVIAPDETIARMALVVGVTADDLDEAGRPDAAEVLRHLVADSDQPDVELEQVSTDRLLGEIRRRIEGVGYVEAPSGAAESAASGTGGEGEKTELVDNPEDGRANEAARRAAGRVRKAAQEHREIR